MKSNINIQEFNKIVAEVSQELTFGEIGAVKDCVDDNAEKLNYIIAGYAYALYKERMADKEAR